MSFMQTLHHRWHAANTLLWHIKTGFDPVFTFCRNIIDATAQYACAFKPQIAHFAALGAEDALARSITHIHKNHPGIPVILDAKRGDIGSTAEYYAREAFDRYQADAVTVNPYLGRDSVQPFLERKDKGVILLCRTSNPGAGDVQDLLVEGRPLYQYLAKQVADKWNAYGNCALVVGATWPEQLREVRAIIGEMPLLVPGVGAQGGDAEAVVKNASTTGGSGLMVSASRSILYASNGRDYAHAAAIAACNLRDTLRSAAGITTGR